MFVHVLGSAAGGGFPQWNCNCNNCRGVRDGSIKAHPRTQSSIAVSSDGINWALLNASPDILTQIKVFPKIQPARSLRDSGIRAVVLMDAQIDHTTGLLMLREGSKLNLYSTSCVYHDLRSVNPLLKVLDHYCGSEWHEIHAEPAQAFSVDGVEHLSFAPLPLKSNAPPYSTRRDQPLPGDNIGLQITDTRSSKKLFYAPGLGVAEAHVLIAMQEADCVLVDGTFWTEDEMITQGLGKKPAASMGHLPQSGKGGMIEILAGMNKPRKILIHINNTNPILNEDSEQRKILAQQKIEVAHDGMEITL
ncbi:MAG: pyrroloquinoline quinone biosynthesis protein PqqB [Burkholderiales bacterium]